MDISNLLSILLFILIFISTLFAIIYNKFYDKINFITKITINQYYIYSYIVLGTTLLLNILFFNIKYIRYILGKLSSQYILFFIIFLLNLLAYFNNPYRFVKKPLCFGIPCHYISIFNVFLTIFSNFFLFYQLLKKTSYLNIKKLIYLILIPLLIVISFILYIFFSTKYHDTLINKPKYLLNFPLRIILYISILVFNSIIWFQNFTEKSLGKNNFYLNITKNLNLFNTFHGSKFSNIIGYFSIFTFLIFDFFTLVKQLQYHCSINISNIKNNKCWNDNRNKFNFIISNPSIIISTIFSFIFIIISIYSKIIKN